MLIRNARILDASFDIRTADLLVGTRIEQIFPGGVESDFHYAGAIVDVEGDLLIPGLVDIHTHGALGMDSMSASLEFARWRRYLQENGITTFFPTTVTEDDTAIERAVRNLADADGIYLEGPYINAEKNGAHDKNKIHPVDAFLEKMAGKLRIVALAPEFPENMSVIEDLRTRGVRVSLGHSSADYETGRKAFEKGASLLVHTFNAMNPLTHREPNLIGAALDNDDVFCEVISDGIHLHPAIVRILFRILGPKRMVLISDSMAATGFQDGDYLLGDLKVTVRDHIARTEYGAIAGSTNNLMEMVRKAVSFGIPLPAAVEMASQTPARAAGIDQEVGSIQVGRQANLVRCSDDLTIKTVYYHGVDIFGGR
jgi:N-acetylglucosamine-6-phosphate deacetylase